MGSRRRRDRWRQCCGRKYFRGLLAFRWRFVRRVADTILRFIRWRGKNCWSTPARVSPIKDVKGCGKTEFGRFRRKVRGIRQKLPVSVKQVRLCADEMAAIGSIHLLAGAGGSRHGGAVRHLGGTVFSATALVRVRPCGVDRMIGKA